MLNRTSALLLAGLFLVVPTLAAAEAPAPKLPVKLSESSLSSLAKRLATQRLEHTTRPSTLPSYVPPRYRTNPLFPSRRPLVATLPTYQLHRETALQQPSALMRHAYSRLLAERGQATSVAHLQAEFKKPVPFMCRLSEMAGCLRFDVPTLHEPAGP